MGQNFIEVADQSLFEVGMYISIGGNETKQISAMSSLILDSPLQANYGVDTQVIQVAPPISFGGENIRAREVAATGVSGSLVGGSISKWSRSTWLGIIVGLCMLGCCGVTALFGWGQFQRKPAKRSGTERERELKDMMMSEAETQPIMSNLGETDLAGPPAAPMFTSMELKAASDYIPQGTIYNVAAPAGIGGFPMPPTHFYQPTASYQMPQTQLGMTTSLPHMGSPSMVFVETVQPSSSMYTGSMYSPYVM
jgi:hypothetical protein